jgi:hypothetical protein
MSTGASLEAWFIHYELVMKLLGETAAVRVTNGLPSQDAPFAEAHWRHAFETALARYLECTQVASLAATHVAGTTRPGLLVWLDQDLSFKGVAAARASSALRATFSGTLDVDRTVRITGNFNPARVGTDTAAGELSGRTRQFMLGYVRELSSKLVVLRPIFIGQRWLPVRGAGYDLEVRDAAHVWPQQIDQFRGVNFTARLTKSDLDVLRGIPEEQIKRWFADLIGEPDVPKDWGGEQFDLWTSRLSMDDEPLRAAIAFKGPAAFHPMTIADLGKNGDQIDRLDATAADLLVVQHCHSITAPVVNMLRTYATSPGRIRRYMTIDGYNTIRILRHFGYIS